MLRILVVDDEARHRSGLIDLLRSIRPDHLLFDASDGDEALRMLRAISVDVVITDIRMPNVDGLALIETISRLYPAIETVILSVYGEFSYAKKALDSGAAAYLLKPVDRGEVENLLEKLETLFETREKALTDQETLKRRLNETVPVYNNHLLNLLIRGQLGKERTAEACGPLRLDRPGVVLLFDSDGRAPDVSPAAHAELLSRIHEAALAALDAHGRFQLFDLENADSTAVALLGVDQAPAKAALESLLARLDRQFGPVVSISSSNVHPDLSSDARKAYDEAFVALQFKFYNAGRLLFFHDLRHDRFPITRDWYKDEEKLALSLVGLDRQKSTGVFIDAIDDFVGSARPLPNALKQWVTHIILEQLKRIGDTASTETLRAVSESLARIHERETDFSRLKAIVAEVVSAIVHELEQRRTAVNYDLIERCREHIRAHYMNDLSLDSVAELFHFNPSYFSTLFKSLSGSGFTDYLLEVRMARALELLRDGDEKIATVSAQAGYRDPSYFARVFRRRYGVSPEEYRKTTAARSASPRAE